MNKLEDTTRGHRPSTNGAGDKLDKLIEVHGRDLFHTATYLTGSQQGAQDLTVAAFTRAYVATKSQSVSELNKMDLLEALAEQYRAGSGTTEQNLDHGGRHRFRSESEFQGNWWDSADGDLDMIYDIRELIDRDDLLRILRELPPQERLAYSLKCTQHLSKLEIAEVMDATPALVRRYLAAARRHLARRLHKLATKRLAVV